MKLRAPALAAVVLILSAGLTSAGQPSSFEDAKLLSEKSGRPLLLKVGTSWCKACKAFEAAVEEEAGFREGITRDVVLYYVDAERGEGVGVARNYNVEGYPTFILANGSGDILDRWMGFDRQQQFQESLASALSDPTTLAEKVERFREHPNEADARKLGDIRQYEGYAAEAVAYFRAAQELAPESETNYDLRIFGAMARGHWGRLYPVDDVARQADAVFANADLEAGEMLEVLYSMKKISGKTHQPELAVPYLQATVERTAGADGKLAKQRAWLLPDYALHVERNPEKAVALRKDVAPEGWQDDSKMLNNFAWWCFENGVNLDEAEELARRGVELAEAGTMKANVLDTLAEICNAKQDCSHAVEYIRLAIVEDPENEYFQHQLVRFEEILALQ